MTAGQLAAGWLATQPSPPQLGTTGPRRCLQKIFQQKYSTNIASYSDTPFLLLCSNGRYWELCLLLTQGRSPPIRDLHAWYACNLMRWIWLSRVIFNFCCCFPRISFQFYLSPDKAGEEAPHRLAMEWECCVSPPVLLQPKYWLKTYMVFHLPQTGLLSWVCLKIFSWK